MPDQQLLVFVICSFKGMNGAFYGYTLEFSNLFSKNMVHSVGVALSDLGLIMVSLILFTLKISETESRIMPFSHVIVNFQSIVIVTFTSHVVARALPFSFFDRIFEISTLEIIGNN